MICLETNWCFCASAVGGSASIWLKLGRLPAHGLAPRCLLVWLKGWRRTSSKVSCTLIRKCQSIKCATLVFLLLYAFSIWHFRLALETIDKWTDNLDITDYASLVIHPIVRTLDQSAPLRNTAMDTLCALVVQLGRKYHFFIPAVDKILRKHNIKHQRYDILICRIIKVRNWNNKKTRNRDTPMLERKESKCV